MRQLQGDNVEHHSHTLHAAKCYHLGCVSRVRGVTQTFSSMPQAKILTTVLYNSFSAFKNLASLHAGQFPFPHMNANKIVTVLLLSSVNNRHINMQLSLFSVAC